MMKKMVRLRMKQKMYLLNKRMGRLRRMGKRRSRNRRGRMHLAMLWEPLPQRHSLMQKCVCGGVWVWVCMYAYNVSDGCTY